METVYKVNLDTKDSVKSAKELDKATEQAAKEIDKLQKTANNNSGTSNFDKKLAEINKRVNSGELDFRQLNRTIKEYQTIAVNAGRDSPVGREALAQAAALRDRLVDLDSEVRRLSQDGQALQGALALGSTVVAGYQAFAGVSALVGSENEELLAVMTKLQATQSVLMAIETVRKNLEKESVLQLQAKVALEKGQLFLEKARTAVVGLFTGAVKGQTVATQGAAVAQRVLNIVMNANPIGLLIAGITALIALFAIFSGSAQDNKDKQEALADSIEETNQALERQNAILDEMNADNQKRLDNQQKLIDGEIKYLQSIKNRTKEEEAMLQKKLGEKQAIEIEKIDKSIDNAQKKTENFGKSFAQQFEAIDLAIKGTDIEDGVNDIDYSKARNEVKEFKKELLAVVNSDLKEEEKVKKLRALEGQYGKVTKKLNAYNRELGEAEQEEFTGAIDGWKEIGTLLTKNRTTLREYNTLVQDKKTVIALRDQADALEDLEKKQKEAEAASKRREEYRQKAEQKRKQDEADRQKIIEENIAFEKRVQDIRISLIEDSVDRELAQLDIKFEREMAAITSQSEEANALREQLTLEFFAKEKEIEDRVNEEKKVKAAALQEQINAIRQEVTLSENEKELQAIKTKQAQQLEVYRQGLESEMLTEAEFNELKLLQQTEYQAKLDAIADAAREAQLAKDKEANDKKLALLNEGVSFAAGAAGSLKSLSETVKETQINNAEGNEQKQEELRRKGFERNKKMQITQATIAGIQGVINTLTAPSVIPEPFGTILKGASAAILGATTFANIAKIKSTKYGGSGGGKPSTGSGANAGASASQLGPRNLSDVRTSLNPDGSVSDTGDDPDTDKRVYILESDVTGTQNKVKAQQTRSTY